MTDYTKYPFITSNSSGEDSSGESSSSENTESNTTFRELGEFFLAGITDDMFLELTLEDTIAIIDELILAAIPHFEFPRKDIFDLDLENASFRCHLTLEEMMILRQYMISEWISYQLATIDNIRQKYSGSDFKFTSQASHMKQLIAMKENYEKQGFHLQRLYCRRKKSGQGAYISTMEKIMEPRS